MKSEVRKAFLILYTVKFRLSKCYPQSYPQQGKYAHSVDKNEFMNNLQIIFNKF